MRGLRAFELGRVEHLVAYLARRSPGPFKRKVAKHLWLADFGHFRIHRVSLMGLAYARSLTGRRRTASHPLWRPYA